MTKKLSYHIPNTAKQMKGAVFVLCLIVNYVIYQYSPVLRLYKIGDSYIERLCGTLLEWYSHVKTEVFGGKPVPVPLYSPQILDGLAWVRNCFCGEGLVTNHLCHDTAMMFLINYHIDHFWCSLKKSVSPLKWRKFQPVIWIYALTHL
jgi:hypothetical protein